jgi:zinc-ribbon domain
MLETMYVRCTHCGYDNNPEYRFCGMCGASLARPAAAPPAAREAARASAAGREQAENVHGPSFLGLAEDPKVEFHYLYEDEQPRSRVGLVLFLFIALGLAGYLAWQWRHNGFPFSRLSVAENSSSQPSASPSEVAPASNEEQETHIEKPMTGVGDAPPPSASSPSVENPSASKPAEGNAQGGSASADQNLAANKNPTPADNQNAAPDKSTENPQQANATPPPGVAEASKTAKESTRTPKPAPSVAAAPATSADASLELQGERYLYGNGVPQNCSRAENSLRTAAMHGNSKAETVLGTMYATGHCVGRDLPTAYRWFARALHEEPQNSRISDDLQVLWRQMTPQEKQLAMAGQ